MSLDRLWSSLRCCYCYSSRQIKHHRPMRKGSLLLHKPQGSSERQIADASYTYLEMRDKVGWNDILASGLRRSVGFSCATEFLEGRIDPHRHSGVLIVLACLWLSNRHTVDTAYERPNRTKCSFFILPLFPHRDHTTNCSLKCQPKKISICLFMVWKVHKIPNHRSYF